MPLTRADFRLLADTRLAEAAALLAAGFWDGAYYLAGYAVECGLKACIMAYVERTGVIFEDKKYAERCWTHDLSALLLLADLKPDLDAASAADRVLEGNWKATIVWNESRRYVRTPEADARKLYAALTDPTHGVMPWIKRHW